MPSCAAVGCQNRTEDPNPTISWKYLPTRNKRQKELWLTYIKSTGGLPQQRNTARCSNHFDSECFERNSGGPKHKICASLDTRMKTSEYIHIVSAIIFLPEGKHFGALKGV